MSWPWISAFGALTACVVVMGVVFLGLLRRAMVVFERLEVWTASRGALDGFGGASRGSRLPAFDVVDSNGQVIGSEALFGSEAVYVFLSSGCEPCEALVGELSQLLDGAVNGVPVRLILNEQSDLESLAIPRTMTVFFQPDRAASQAFGNVASPQAFLIDQSGVVVDRVIPNSLEGLRMLFRESERVAVDSGMA